MAIVQTTTHLWSGALAAQMLTLKNFGFLLILAAVIAVARYGNNAENDDEKHSRIQRASFGVPIFGHVFSFLCNPSGFLRYNRDRIQHGIFGLKFFGVDTYIIHSPSLMRSFFALPGSVIEHKTMGANIITKIFGFPPGEVQDMITHFDELMNTFVTHLMRGPGLEDSWNKLLADIEQTVPRIVSAVAPPSPSSSGSSNTENHQNSDSLSGKLQRWWEKSAGVEYNNSRGGQAPAVTASLFPLVRNCAGALSSREMMGSTFVASHPGFLEDVWEVDANIMGFVFGYPGWLPWIARARRARTRILGKLVAWHTAMEESGPVADTGAPEFADVGSLMQARQKIWSARGFSVQARAAVDLSILWALNANSNSAVYWMLRNIHATPGLVARVRAEIAPSARLTEDGMLKIDWKGLVDGSPLFKACYFESLRIDSAPWSFKRLRKSCTVAGDDAVQTQATFHLPEGSAVLVPADLHHTDARFYEDPESFVPERFIVEDDEGLREEDDDADKGPSKAKTKKMGRQAKIKTIRPYGGGATMCKGRILAEREVLSFVAAMLTCWDMEPVEGSSWDMDGRERTSGVCKPQQDLKVRLTPRRARPGI